MLTPFAMRQTLYGACMTLSSTIISSTGARLLFFGGRYISLLLVARLLGPDAAGFLLSLAVVETLRVLFDYGLENSVLARFHQGSNSDHLAFEQGKRVVRIGATLLGQMVSSGLVFLFCLRSNAPLALPLVASLQFSCLMAFGYMQAHLQTGKPGLMAALVPPLVIALTIQGLLLLLSYFSLIPAVVVGVSFEVMALCASIYAMRRDGWRVGPPVRERNIPRRVAGMAVLVRIAPLGNVALVGIAYNRLDAFVVSWIGGGILLTQYMLYQRLASAPLMFFSTVASSGISTLSGQSGAEPEALNRIRIFRKVAYGAGAACGILLFVLSPFVNSFFALAASNVILLAFQALIVSVQIANGFHAAILIALGRLPDLWRIARNNGILACVILPLLAWAYGIIGVAGAICAIEIFCAIQHALAIHRGPGNLRGLHA